MRQLVDDFAKAHPDYVIRRVSEIYIAAERVLELIDEIERQDARLLGLEGFIVGDAHAYPALSRIVDYSNDDTESALRKARVLLDGSWSQPPGPGDQMHSDASGRHMMVVVVADS